jgi:hypothetical protein
MTAVMKPPENAQETAMSSIPVSMQTPVSLCNGCTLFAIFNALIGPNCTNIGLYSIVLFFDIYLLYEALIQQKRRSIPD